MIKRYLRLLTTFFTVLLLLPFSVGTADSKDSLALEDADNLILSGSLFSESDSDTLFDFSDGSEHVIGDYPDNAEEERTSNPNLAYTGSIVWRIGDGMVICEDVSTGEEAAAYPVSWLHAENESTEYASVLSKTEDRVQLCLCVRDKADAIRVELMDLYVEEHAVNMDNCRDVTSALGYLFDGSIEWNEVSMTSCGQKILIEAMDSNFSLTLSIYDPEMGTIVSLGEQSLLFYRAAIPGNENILLVSTNIEKNNLLDLSVISPVDGNTEKLGSVRVESAANAANFAWTTEENRLYFTINSAAYAASIGTEEDAEAIGAFSSVPLMLQLGIVAGDRYVVWGEGTNAEGELLSCDIHGHLAAENLRISDPLGEDAVSEAALSFGVEHPGYTVSVIDSSNTESPSEDDLPSSDYDLFVLTLKSDKWKKLVEMNGLADLSSSASLISKIQDMPDSIRSSLLCDGQLVAFPLSVTTYCQTLNVSALGELLGLAPEEVPTDWVGFLKMIQKLASKGLLSNNADYSLYGLDFSADEFRASMLNWLLQDTHLWLEQDPARIDQLQKVLTPILTAFNKVDWYRLGLSEAAGYDEEEEAFYFTSEVENTYLLMDNILEIALMDLEDGEEFWPLSIGDGERSVSQVVNVLCVNPDSPNLDAAIQFIEATWENTDITTKYSLCQSMHEPILNEDYEDDIAYLEELASSYEKNLSSTTDPLEVKALTAELDELKEFLEDYRENGLWLITEDSISQYRALTEQSVLIADSEWGMESEDSPSWQFLSGELSPKQYVKELVSSLEAQS